MPFIELLVDFNAAARDDMELRSGRETVPQIFIGQTHVGGYDDLSALVNAGGLPGLLQKERQIAETHTKTPLEND